MSHTSRKAIQQVLRKHYAKVGITLINNILDLERLLSIKPDLVFLGMKFVPMHSDIGFSDPEKIWLSDYLSENGIACTGSNSTAHELELSKPLAKQCIIDAGLKTSPFYVAKMHAKISEEDIKLTYPLFIKPVDRGGGDGVDSQSYAIDFNELQAKVASITATIGSDSLIEEYLPGREISVAILKDINSHDYTTMPIERIVPDNIRGLKILSHDIKHADAGLSIAVSDDYVRAQVSELAINTFHALGARDYGRIDIRLDENGTPTFLEANLLPSLIDGNGNFPKAYALNTQSSYEVMLLNIVHLGMRRSITSHLDDMDIILSTPVLKPVEFVPKP